MPTFKGLGTAVFGLAEVWPERYGAGDCSVDCNRGRDLEKKIPQSYGYRYMDDAVPRSVITDWSAGGWDQVF